MLKVFRDNLKNLAPVLWVVIAVFVLLMFANPDGNSAAASNVAATVNGREISFVDYRQAYQNLENRFRGIYGESYTPELAKQIGLPMQALNSLVAQQILLAEAEDLGLTATDGEVRDSISEVAAFQNANGSFDNDLYLQILRANRLTSASFEDSTREQLMLQKFNRVLADAVWISDAEAEQTAREETESAQIKYLKLTAADISEDQPVTQDELDTFFSDHRDDYRMAERRSLAYVTFNTNVVRASLEISDEELQAYYDQNPDEFTSEEQVRARHILLFVNEDRTAEAAQDELENLKARAEAGEKFQDLAKQYSEDEATKERGGQLGFFGRNRMTPQFETAAFSGEVGSVVGPVENQLGPRTGYHLILVENKREGGLQEFETVKNRIRVRQQNDRARTRSEELSQGLFAELNGRKFTARDELEAFASENDLLAYKATDSIDRDAAVPGIGRNANFIQAAFAVDSGVLSEPVRVGAGWALVTAFDVEPPRLPELTEVETQVRSALQLEKKDAAAIAKLEQAKENLGPDATIEALAKAVGKEVAESSLIRMTGAVPGISTDVTFNHLVLDHDEGDIGGPVKATDGAVLFEVATRNRFDPEVFETEKASTLERLRNQRVSSMVQSLIERRRGEIKLTVSPQLQESFEQPTSSGG